jgi:hypothetical protein
VMRRHGPAIEASGAEARTDLRFAKYMRALDGRKLRLKREAVAPFMQEFEEDIAWAEARVGTSLRQLRDTDPPEAIATEAELQACAAAGIDWINAQKTAGGEPLPADAGLVRLGRSMYKLRRSFAKRDAKQRRRDKPQDAPGRSAEEADESNDMLT